MINTDIALAVTATALFFALLSSLPEERPPFPTVLFIGFRLACYSAVVLWLLFR